MSYNIDSWEQIECSLTFPASLLDDDELDIIEDVEYGKPGDSTDVTIELGMGGELKGALTGDTVTVRELSMTGEGSGSHMEDLIVLLEQTSGTYTAFLVWEGGDSLSLLTVEEGMFKDENLDIPALLRENAELKARLAALEKQTEEL